MTELERFTLGLVTLERFTLAGRVTVLLGAVVVLGAVLLPVA